MAGRHPATVTLVSGLAVMTVRKYHQPGRSPLFLTTVNRRRRLDVCVRCLQPSGCACGPQRAGHIAPATWAWVPTSLHGLGECTLPFSFPFWEVVQIAASSHPWLEHGCKANSTFQTHPISRSPIRPERMGMRTAPCVSV